MSKQDGSGYGIYGKIYNHNGTVFKEEFQINTYTSNSQYKPSIGIFKDGRFVVV